MSYVILEFSEGKKDAEDIIGPYSFQGDALEVLDSLRDQEAHLRKGVTYQLGRVEVEK